MKTGKHRLRQVGRGQDGGWYRRLGVDIWGHIAPLPFNSWSLKDWYAIGL